MFNGFQCALLLDNGTIFIGTADGKIYQSQLKEYNNIHNLKFENDENYISVLESYKQEIYVMKGIIRSIQKFNKEEILILSHYGGIILYNFNSNTKYVINKEDYIKRWKLLIIDENQFITIGNYGLIELWSKDKDHFKNISFYPYNHASFCIDWINKEEGSFIINNYAGVSLIYYIKDSEIIEQQHLQLEKNLQKTLIFENYLIAVNYYGEVSIYNKKDNFKKVTKFQIDASRGNWVQISKEINNILIGTDSKLLILNENFQEILELDVCIRQIFSYKNLDLFLTNDDVVKINYSNAKSPKKIKDFKFKKIGLVGNSQTGKTSFCRFLDTGKGESPESTFGTHLWSIPINKEPDLFFDTIGDRRVLYLDLAGQEEEHFTYFPKIYDSDVILLFFHASRPDTFNEAIKYYIELKENCKKAKFYFIQTHSDQFKRVIPSTIEREFNKINVDIDSQLIKLDNRSGNGFDEYRKKVLDNLEWESSPITYRIPIFDDIEIIIHDFYIKGKVNEISLDEFSDVINLDKIRTENIVMSYYDQGYIDYLVHDKIILINHERYAQIQTLVATVIVQNQGQASNQLIYSEIMKDSIDGKFITNILNYYRRYKIGAIFKEDDVKKEVFIFPRKLSKDLIINKDLNKFLPKNFITFKYDKIKVDIERVISYLNKFPLNLKAICQDEILLSRDGSNDNALLHIKLNKKTEQTDILSTSFGINIKEKIDKEIEDGLIFFFWNLLNPNLKDFSLLESDLIFINTAEQDFIILKQILNYPCERPYLDFKTLLDLSDTANKAEFVKDVIGLTNMAYLCGNISLMVVGIEEKKCEIKSFRNVDNFDILEQQISQIIEDLINYGPSLEIIPLNINEIFKWQQNGEITTILPFKTEHKNGLCQEKILLIKFHRIANCVCEIDHDFNFINKNGKPDKYNKGVSWMRIGSHSFKINEQHRIFLREKS